jgi:hypothetical protein
VFSGMLGVTIFGILFTPVFYYVIRKMTGHSTTPPPSGSPTTDGTGVHPPAMTPTTTAGATH